MNLVEWLYQRVSFPASWHRVNFVSLVVRVKNQEATIERTMRELMSLWTEQQWAHSDIDVIISDGGSRDQTAVIVERLATRYPGFKVADSGLDEASVLGLCNYPVVIWVDYSKGHRIGSIVPTVHQLLAQNPLRSKNLSG
jgi:glycosyltransferase involved in cell wall biosynthesis